MTPAKRRPDAGPQALNTTSTFSATHSDPLPSATLSWLSQKASATEHTQNSWKRRSCRWRWASAPTASRWRTP